MLQYLLDLSLQPLKPENRNMHKFIPYQEYKEYPSNEMKKRAQDFYEDLRRRRTVREFSDRPIPREIIENCLLAAGTAPNGANRQPWHFVVVESPDIKRKIRGAAEEEEKTFYTKRATEDWLNALEPLGTDQNKPFLEIAPYLIVIFGESFERTEENQKVKNYYVTESVGIATGILITAIHNAGLVSLTHTPSPMKFLNQVLGRPNNERPFLILVVGYPAENTEVPSIEKKSLEKIATFI